MNEKWQFFLRNWKSTASNALTLVALTGGYFTAIPSPTLQEHGVSQHEIFWATVITGLAKLYIGLITKDCDKKKGECE